MPPRRLARPRPAPRGDDFGSAARPGMLRSDAQGTARQAGAKTAPRVRWRLCPSPEGWLAPKRCDYRKALLYRQNGTGPAVLRPMLQFRSQPECPWARSCLVSGPEGPFDRETATAVPTGTQGQCLFKRSVPPAGRAGRIWLARRKGPGRAASILWWGRGSCRSYDRSASAFRRAGASSRRSRGRCAVQWSFRRFRTFPSDR